MFLIETKQETEEIEKFRSLNFQRVFHMEMNLMNFCC